ncbi:MAG: SLBB domain-containing protein [Fibrobacterota bacterium]
MKYLVLLLCLSVTSYPLEMSGQYSGERVAVEVSGARVTPGTYHVSPNQRIVDVIKTANDGVLPPLEEINCRAVIATDSMGNEEVYDILRYVNTGDLSQNPYVIGGQSIHVGFATKRVYISGDIQGVVTGNMPIRDAETASDFLSLYTLNATADTANILFERVGEESREYSLSELSDITLQDQDGITVFPHRKRREVFRVHMKGEVLRPGMYAIEHNETSARELIKKAGGPGPRGDTSRSWVVRRGKIESMPREALLEGTEHIRREITYSMSNAITSGDYGIIPLWEGDVILEDGDEVVVPPAEDMVFLSGSVKRPGVYPYKPDKGSAYYIDRAGGFRESADEESVYTLEIYGDYYRTLSDDTIRAGNMIVVPDRDREGRTRFALDIVRTSATILTSLVTLGSFIINISE